MYFEFMSEDREETKVKSRRPEWKRSKRDGKDKRSKKKQRKLSKCESEDLSIRGFVNQRVRERGKN